MHILAPKFQRGSLFLCLHKRCSLPAPSPHPQSLHPCPGFSLGNSDSRLSLQPNPDKNAKSDRRNPRKLGRQGRSPSWGRECYFNKVILTFRPSEHPGLIPGAQSREKTGRARDFVGCVHHLTENGSNNQQDGTAEFGLKKQKRF